MVKYRVLSKEEQDELLKKYYETKDPEIKKLLIEVNIRLVKHITKNYHKSVCFDRDDILSVGVLGLMRAVETYDPYMGYKFSSYASRCITSALHAEIRGLKIASNVVSYGVNFGQHNDKTDLNKLTLLDSIVSDYDVEEVGETNYLVSQIHEKIDDLPERKKLILYDFFGLDSGEPKREIEIAKKLGVSVQYINRIKNNGINEVKKAFDEKAKDEKGK